MTGIKVERWVEAQEAESNFWKLKLKNNSPLPPESLERYEKCIDLLPFPISHLTRVLDVGSGPCGGAPLFTSKSCFKVSLDPLIGKNALRCKNGKRDNNLMRAAGECLPFKQGVFDVVFCVNVLDHSYEPLRLLTEVFKVLRLSGVLIVMVHITTLKQKIIHHLISETRFRKISAAIQDLRRSFVIDRVLLELSSLAFGGLDVLADGIFHPYYFGLDEVIAFFNQAGLAINKIRLCQSPWNYKQDLFLVAHRCQTNS